MFSRMIALLLALCLSTPSFAALTRRETVIAGSPADSMEVRHLVLTGTNEEIGRALAELAQERYDTRLERSRDKLRTRAQRRYIEQNFPILHDRMRGVAAAYGVRLDDDSIDATALGFTELRAGCSIVHLPPALTENGKSVVSRDYDYSTGNLFFGFLPPGKLHPTARPYLLELHPDRGYASIAMVAYDLLSGVLDGMNSEGLTVTMAMDDESFASKQVEPTYGPAVGLGVLQMMRVVLDTCATVDEAKETLLTTKQYYEYVPVHFLIADRFGHSFIWEYSKFHNKEYVIENPGRPLMMTNFNLVSHMEEDKPPTADQARPVCKRYAYLTDKLTGATQISEETLRNTHRAVDAQAPVRPDAKRPPVRTFWHVLYYPEERRAKFSYYLRDEVVPGQPDKVHIARTDYIEFRLDPTSKEVAPAPAAQPVKLAEPAAQSNDPLVTKLRNAGATVNLERDRIVAVSLSKAGDPRALLPLLPKTLRVLSLNDTDIGDADLKVVATFKQLEQLGLKGTKITDAGLAQIAGLSRLEILALSGTNVTDAGLAHVAKLEGITGLNLTGTKITDAGLPQLKPLGRLTKLNVTDTAVTEAGAKKAKEFLPFWAKVQR